MKLRPVAWCKSELDRFDVALARSRPRVRVLRLPVVLLFSAVASALAVLHGRLTPGIPSAVNSTNAGVARWFFVCSLAAVAWMVDQWGERSRLPPGCRAGLLWSPPVSFLCLALLLAPAIAYEQANAVAIREMVPLQPILDAHAERDAKFSPEGKNARYSGPHFSRLDSSGEIEDCKLPMGECLRRGFKIVSKGFIVDAGWCGLDVGSNGRRVITSIYGKALDKVCATMDLEDGRFIVPAPAEGTVIRMSANLNLIYAAHGLVVYPGVFRGHMGILLFLVLVHIFASVMAAFSVLPLKWVGGASGLFAGGLVFVFAFSDNLGGDRAALAHGMNTALIVVPLGALIRVRVARHRHRNGDLCVLASLLSGSAILIAWRAIAMGSFFTSSLYDKSSRIDLAPGQLGAALYLAASLLLSPVIMAALDRYRNLPAKR